MTLAPILMITAPKGHRQKKTSEQAIHACSDVGGERGIRTLETLLTPTRFPIVRLRPTQPSLHGECSTCCALVAGNGLYYSRFFSFVKRKIEKSQKIFSGRFSRPGARKDPIQGGSRTAENRSVQGRRARSRGGKTSQRGDGGTVSFCYNL